MELLTKENPKTVKGRKQGYETVILHLAPHTSAGIITQGGELFNACPFAGNCIEPCLNYSGHGGMGDPDTNNVQIARRQRTKLFFHNPDLFYEMLRSEITRAIKRATKQGRKLAIRPNGTSDIPAIGRWVAEQFPNTQVYDYTKIPQPWKRVRSNYHLTFSWEGNNWDECKDALDHGINVALPYGGDMPEEFRGYRVIDGDESDLRFNDPHPVMVGLSAKGPAKKDASGFVVR
jgi:hypothetical protein